MKTKMLKIDSIIRDYQFYPRSQTDEVTAGQFAEQLTLGAQFPPIQVCSKTLRVIDGFTRLRAHERIDREDIECLLVDVADDKEFFALAVAANAHHGRRYTPFDVRHIIQRSRELGIEVDRICGAAEITATRYDEIVRGFATNRANEEVPIKNTIKHMAGRKLTKRQAEANRRLSGMNQTFYVNQIIELIEADLLDFENPALLERLKLLGDLLKNVLRNREAA